MLKKYFNIYSRDIVHALSTSPHLGHFSGHQPNINYWNLPFSACGFLFLFFNPEPAFPTLMPGTFTECQNNQGIHSLQEPSSPSFWGGVSLRSACKAPDGLRTSRLWWRFAWQSTRSSVCGHQPVSLLPTPHPAPQCSLNAQTAVHTQNLVSRAASRGIQTETKPNYFSTLWGKSANPTKVKQPPAHFLGENQGTDASSDKAAVTHGETITATLHLSELCFPAFQHA